MNDLKFTTAEDYMQSTDIILQFAQQSGIKSVNEFSLSTQEQKFAELIINECAELAGCNGHVSGFMLSDLIKEHFKLKEQS